MTTYELVRGIDLARHDVRRNVMISLNEQIARSVLNLENTLEAL